MARTYRRKKGDQHWKRYINSWKSVLMIRYQVGLIDEDTIIDYIKLDKEDELLQKLHWERDSEDSSACKMIKYVSNKNFRGNEKKQLLRIMKITEGDEYAYDPSKELKTRRLSLYFK